MVSARERRLRIFESNFGRDAGWYVEYEEHRIAVLTDPRPADMFWYSYTIDPLVEDLGRRADLLDSRVHWDRCDFIYRNRVFDQTAPGWVSAGQPPFENGRALMRGLYLNIGHPSLWERFLLVLRGSHRAAFNDLPFWTFL
jgi:hypothetical protein